MSEPGTVDWQYSLVHSCAILYWAQTDRVVKGEWERKRRVGGGGKERERERRPSEGSLACYAVAVEPRGGWRERRRGRGRGGLWSAGESRGDSTLLSIEMGAFDFFFWVYHVKSAIN